MGAAAAPWVRVEEEEPYQADPSGANGAKDDSIEELRDEIATLSAHIDAVPRETGVDAHLASASWHTRTPKSTPVRLIGTLLANETITCL